MGVDLCSAIGNGAIAPGGGGSLAGAKVRARMTIEEEFSLNRPLMEFLRSVPMGYQCHWEGHSFIPLRRYCEAAATRIERLERELNAPHTSQSGSD